MKSRTAYLKYSEITSEPDELDDEADMDGYDDDVDPSDCDSRTSSEFTPLGLCLVEPRGDYLELELDFEAETGETLHVVVAWHSSPRSGRLEDWCVESVLRDEDEAAEAAEALEDGVQDSQCARENSDDAVVTRADVFSLSVTAR